MEHALHMCRSAWMWVVYQPVIVRSLRLAVSRFVVVLRAAVQ